MENVRKTVVLTIAVTVLPVSTVFAGFEAPVEDVYQSGNYSSEPRTATPAKKPSGPSRVFSAWRQAASDVMHPHQTQKQQFVAAEEDDGQGQARVVAAGESGGVVTSAAGGVLNTVDTLREELADLRGQVELMSHEMRQLQQQQRQMYDDMDKRIRQATKEREAISTGNDVTGFAEEPVVPNTTVPKAEIAKAPESTNDTNPKKTTTKNKMPQNRVTQEEAMHVLQEQRAYKVAYAALRAKHYDDATAQFQQYLNHYPKGAFAANAYYWLGELYLLSGNETEASNAFNTVVAKYPHSSKVPDALLKKGYMYFSKDQYNDARKIFNVIQRKYPNTTAAELAKQRSQQLKHLSSR